MSADQDLTTAAGNVDLTPTPGQTIAYLTFKSIHRRTT